MLELENTLNPNSQRDLALTDGIVYPEGQVFSHYQFKCGKPYFYFLLKIKDTSGFNVRYFRFKICTETVLNELIHMIYVCGRQTVHGVNFDQNWQRTIENCNF